MIEKKLEKKYDTVLVDFDGTLMDTNDLIVQSWMHAIKKYTGKEGNLEEVKQSFGETIALSMPRLIPNVPLDEAVDTYREYQIVNYLENIQPFEGANDTLEKLKAAGYKLALVTSRMERSTFAGLKHFDLEKYFEVIITADNCPEHKPSPLPLLMAMEKLGSEPEKTIMIGDTKHDIGASIAAGVTSVLVDYSVALPPEKRADTEKPDYIIEKFADILPLVGA